MNLFKARWTTDFRYPAEPFIKGDLVTADGQELSIEFYPPRSFDDYGVVFFFAEDGEVFACRAYLKRNRLTLSRFYASETCYEDVCQKFARNRRSRVAFAEKLKAVYATNREAL